MKNILRNILFALLICMSFTINAKQESEFVIFQDAQIVDIFVDKNDSSEVVRAVGDLQNDIKMVTGATANIVNDISKLGKNAIIVGSYKSKLIQDFLKAGKIDEVKSIATNYETFITKPISNPFENVENALVITGSDALGTVYGIYDISEKMGVSPLYWWNDVTPEKKSKVVLNNAYSISKQPTVRYRGIFINDEEALIRWSRLTSKDKSKGHLSPEVYEKVFELILRLRANTLWPSMMYAGNFFYEVKNDDGIAINPLNSKRYGIYIGSSHCENMGRNNYGEWYKWAEKNKHLFESKTEFVFDYTVNPKAIEAYWKERIIESKDFNMIYTIGIRGVHDNGFMHRNLENPNLENRVKFLQKVIDRQREMIAEIFGSADAVPQIFVPYEETNELYNGESKTGEKCEGLKLPEDVTLVWTEDNNSYARQLPNSKETQRKGGNGVYYHIAYQGYPGHYDWLTTLSLPLMHEQMRKYYDSGADRFWIVNVGDINPCEMTLQFFMKLACDIDSYGKNDSKIFLKQASIQHFGVDENKADEIADILTEFNQFATPQKPEFLVSFWNWKWNRSEMFNFFTITNFNDEAQQRINIITSLEKRATNIYNSLSEDRKAPFWHLVYYPVRSMKNILEKSVYYRKNIEYVKQGRFASINAYKALSEQAEIAIQKDLDYYNYELKDGKWNGIMDPYAIYNLTERVYDIANIPNDFLYAQKYIPQSLNELGSVCEGQRIGNEKFALCYSSLEDNSRFIDVFSKGIQTQKWTIESDVDWLKFSKKSGEVFAEERIWSSVDWSKASTGLNKGNIIVKGEDFEKSYPVEAMKFDIALKEKSFVEGCGFVSIEAENYSNKIDGKNAQQWKKYENLGYVGSSMFIKGGKKIDSNLKENSARLEYNVNFTSKGEFYGHIYRLPTLNEGKGNTCQIAIAVNDNEPFVINGVRQKGQKITNTLSDGSKESIMWHTNILNQMERMPFKIKIDKVGYNTIKIYQVDTDIGIDRLIIATTPKAKDSLKTTFIAANESFNNIVEFKKAQIVNPPVLSKDIAKVDDYPVLEPLSKIKFNFAIPSTVAHNGYVTVSPREVYNSKTNLFGWDKDDAKHINYIHNESSHDHDFWQRCHVYGNKETMFYVKMKKGSYKLKLFVGDITNQNNDRAGKNFKMSVYVNNKLVIDNEEFVNDNPTFREFQADVGDDEMLNVKFIGNWGISALEGDSL